MQSLHDHKSLLEIHEDVPAEHYDVGIKRNLFQKYWHFRRFKEILKVIKPVDYLWTTKALSFMLLGFS